jgi:hypothetical protein
LIGNSNRRAIRAVTPDPDRSARAPCGAIQGLRAAAQPIPPWVGVPRRRAPDTGHDPKQTTWMIGAQRAT